MAAKDYADVEKYVRSKLNISGNSTQLVSLLKTDQLTLI